jgi:hypothetical protein
MAQVIAVKSTGRPVKFAHPAHSSATTVIEQSVGGRTRPTTVVRGDTPDPAPQAYTPAYLQWAYDLTALSQTQVSGDTVAIVDAFDDPNADSDLATYRQQFGIWPCTTTVSAADCQTQINADGLFQQYDQTGAAIDQTGDPGTPPPTETTTSEPNDLQPGGWEVEESLDIDAVSTFCSQCRIILLEATPGACDPQNVQVGHSRVYECTYPSLDSNLETAVKSANQLGADQISMSFGEADQLPSAGPPGPWAFSGVASLAASGDDGYPGSGYVVYPAAYQDVTAVGGTSLSAAAGARGFGESVWNDSAGETESGCDPRLPEPTYQDVVATTDCNGRAYNDVSADADPETGLYVYDSFGGSAGFDGMEAVGGTSLATPLTAAYYAVTGVDKKTLSDPGTATGSVAGSVWPAWAYSLAGSLNDVVSGSDGLCAQAALLICNAAAGWDGPTGEGSISGDVVSGAPGIGGDSVTYTNANDVTFTGGIYPNGNDTSYSWQYWVDGADPSTAVTTGTGDANGTLLQSVSDAVCGALQPSTLYDFRLVASSSVGQVESTVPGYYGSFDTPASEAAPNTSSSPTISGTAAAGQTLSAQPGTWNGQSCNTAPSYQWQISTDGAKFTDIPGATASSYTPSATEAVAGTYFRVGVSEAYPATGPGSVSGTEYSAALGPVPGSGSTNPQTTTTPTPPPPTPTPTSTTATTATPTTTTKVQFYRCAHKCTLINTHGATNYNLKPADNGMYIELKVTTTTPGSKPIVTTRWIGPVTAPGAGAATIAHAARIASSLTITGTKHAVLAHVLVSKRTTKAVTLSVTPQGKKPTKVWAYVVKNGDVVSCTVSHTVKSRLKLNVPLKQGQTLKLVAVQA